MNVIQDESPQVAVALIERGADANYVDQSAGRVSVLTLASYMGQLQVVQALLEKKVRERCKVSSSVEIRGWGFSARHTFYCKCLDLSPLHSHIPKTR